ncbi:uncharacterized protein PAC_12483 [Phialocephala subalpina]|uniref:Uncharacterized protein n=1 Tax=Phialocephala subalpina TaxID=576137 RepID=A0A1L7XC62_9HELO|nr:uncharacterized protein PAC_12483 [Phialocephala subalpina]
MDHSEVSRAARSFKIMQYLHHVEMALLAENKPSATSVAKAIANTAPLDNKIILLPSIIPVVCRIFNDALVMRSLSTSHPVLSLCVKADEKTALTHEYPRFTSLAAKRVYSPCTSCLANEVSYDLDTVCTCMSSYLPPSPEKEKTGHHCKIYFDEFVEEMKVSNTRHESRRLHEDDDEDLPLLEYKCDCGEESSPLAPRICRLCFGICKPYTLNKDNHVLNDEMGIPKTSSFEHVRDVSWGVDNSWGRVGDGWDNGFCGWFLKPEFFPEPEMEEHPNDDDEGGDDGSSSWVTTDEEISSEEDVAEGDSSSGSSSVWETRDEEIMGGDVERNEDTGPNRGGETNAYFYDEDTLSDESIVRRSIAVEELAEMGVMAMLAVGDLRESRQELEEDENSIQVEGV